VSGFGSEGCCKYFSQSYSVTLKLEATRSVETSEQTYHLIQCTELKPPFWLLSYLKRKICMLISSSPCPDFMFWTSGMCLQELCTNYVSLQTKHTSHFPISGNELKARATQSHLTLGPEDIYWGRGGEVQYNRQGAGGTYWCPLQSVCRHAPTLAPRRFGPLRGRHGHHSHVPQANAACQLPGVIPQRLSTVVKWMENRR